MCIIEFRYGLEILRAFSDESGVRILRRLRAGEEPMRRLAPDGRGREREFERGFEALERAGLVTREFRDGKEYARINPNLSGIVDNYFSARHWK